MFNVAACPREIGKMLCGGGTDPEPGLGYRVDESLGREASHRFSHDAEANVVVANKGVEPLAFASNDFAVQHRLAKLLVNVFSQGSSLAPTHMLRTSRPAGGPTN